MKPDTYKEIRTFSYPGITVRVHIPDLTEEVRSRRIEGIRKQAARFLKAVKR